MRLIFLSVALLLPSALYSQNVMMVHDTSGNAADTVSVRIEIQNADRFVGFQFDMILPDQISYVDGSAMLSDRVVDHQIVASIVNNNTLRVFAYSLTQSPFSGSSGEVCSFEVKLGTKPGDYPLSLENTVIGDSASLNIITDASNGILTLHAPDVELNVSSMDYDRVPLLQFLDRTFTIQNQGNAVLSVTRIYTSMQDFEIMSDTTLNIQPGASHTATIRFHSNTKGIYDEQVTIISDDPDEPTQVVSLHAVAYAVNELNINDMFGRSGHVATMSIDISNMEAFVGFSFDLTLPEVMTYQANTAALSERAEDHIVAASTIDNGNLRIVSYSPSNLPFTGVEGDLLTLDFIIDGRGGFYNINFDNPVIGDTDMVNILSDFYGGNLEIAAPDIYLDRSSIDFGEVSIFDTLGLSLTVGNSGSDTLLIENILFSDANFFTTFNLPAVVPVGTQIQIPVNFHSGSEGSFNSTMRLWSNDPDEDPISVQLTAASFIPNIMRVDSTIILANDTGWISVSIENNEPFVGFQFDLLLPENFSFAGEVELSERSFDHAVNATELSPDTLRVFAYSLSQKEFSGNAGAVVRVKLQTDSTLGDFYIGLDNVIIGNAQSENVVSSSVGAQINIIYAWPILLEYPLDAGWNLISWDLDTPTDSLGVLLSDIMGNVVVVLGFEAGGLTYDPDWPQFSNLQLADHLHGYWIKTLAADTLKIEAAPVPDDTPIAMEAGWNLVSYLPDYPDSVAHALGSIVDSVIVVLGFDKGGLTFDLDWLQFSNLQILSPKFGYWVKMTGPGTLVYPDTQVASGSLLAKVPSYFSSVSSVVPTNEWVSVLGEEVIFNGRLLEVGTVIQAKDPDGVICGEHVVAKEGRFGMMPVYRDDPGTEVDEGAVPGDEIRIYVDGAEVNERITWSEFGEVYRVGFTPWGRIIPIHYSLSQNYPNPFNPGTQIRYQLPEAGHVSLVIYNILGQRVKSLVNRRKEEGYYSVYWNGKNEEGVEVTSGIYLSRMTAGKFTKTRKMIILR